MNCGIYCITNTINGKRYVGQSIQLKKRFSEHNRGYNHNDHLKRSIKKYGWDKFTIKVLVYCEENDLDYYETTLIEQWDLMNRSKGYNNDSGGNKGKHLSEHTKKKISISKQGQYSGYTPNTFTFKNRKHKVETKLIMSKNAELRLGNKNSNYKGEVIIATNINTEVETYFSSYIETFKHFNSHHVNSVLKGTRKTCKGHTFRYATQEEIYTYTKLNI